MHEPFTAQERQAMFAAVRRNGEPLEPPWDAMQRYEATVRALAERVERLGGALEVAEEFIQTVTEWEGTSGEERVEVFDEIHAAIHEDWSRASE